MGDSNEQPSETLSLFGAACDAAKMFPTIISPDEAWRVTEVCRHNRELYIRCRDCEIEAFLEEVHGLDLYDIDNLRRVNIDLPFFIPIADDFAFQIPITIEETVIGLQLKDTFKKGDGCINHNVVTAGALFQGKSVIQFSSGRDDLIEPMWSAREEIRWFETMSEMGLAAATGVNFSVYESMCPFGQHFNIKKSVLSASLMQSSGVPAIPHIYAVSDNQRARVNYWLNANPQIRLISINCQAQRTEHDLRVLKGTICYLLENSNREIHIILEGFRLPWLDGLYPYLPYLHIAQKQPFMDGLNCSVVDFDPATEHFSYGRKWNPSKEYRAGLVVRSINARCEYLKHLHVKHSGEFKIPLAWRKSGMVLSSQMMNRHA